MATESKAAFDVNIERASYFLQIHEDAQKGAGAPPLPYRELPRAAVVFAVGAADAYLSELSGEVLVSQLTKAVTEGLSTQRTRDVLQKVQKELPTLAIEVGLAGTQAQRMDYVRRAIADYFHNSVSNHGSKAVSATVQRLGGNVADVWSAVPQPGNTTPVSRLDTWTERRHHIVHQGKKTRVRRPDAEGFIEFAKALVARIDQIVEPLK